MPLKLSGIFCVNDYLKLEDLGITPSLGYNPSGLRYFLSNTTIVQVAITIPKTKKNRPK